MAVVLEGKRSHNNVQFKFNILAIDHTQDYLHRRQITSYLVLPSFDVGF